MSISKRILFDGGYYCSKCGLFCEDRNTICKNCYPKESKLNEEKRLKQLLK